MSAPEWKPLVDKDYADQKAAGAASVAQTAAATCESHGSNNNIHITPQEREAWYAKIDQSAMENAIQAALPSLANVDVATNTANGLRAAVKAIAQALGARSVRAAAILLALSGAADAATVTKANFGDIDLDATPAPQVVTNVTFEGLATTGELAAATNAVVQSAAAATNYTDSATQLTPATYGGNGRKYSEWTCTTTPSDLSVVISTNNCFFLIETWDQLQYYTLYYSDDTSSIDYSGTLSGGDSFRLVATRTANPVTGYRLGPADGPNTNKLLQAAGDYTTRDDIKDMSLGGIWDSVLQVWWTPRMRNGSLTYEATTNVNLNAGN